MLGVLGFSPDDEMVYHLRGRPTRPNSPTTCDYPSRTWRRHCPDSPTASSRWSPGSTPSVIDSPRCSTPPRWRSAASSPPPSSPYRRAPHGEIGGGPTGRAVPGGNRPAGARATRHGRGSTGCDREPWLAPSFHRSWSLLPRLTPVSRPARQADCQPAPPGQITAHVDTGSDESWLCR